jgi:hypothetical protein
MKQWENGESWTVRSFIILNSSLSIIRQIISRRMRWAGHVARMGEGRKEVKVLVGKPEEKNHLKDQGVDGRMGSK